MAPRTRARKSAPLKEESSGVLDILTEDLKPIDKFNNVFNRTDLPSSDDEDGDWNVRKRKSTAKPSKTNKRKKATSSMVRPAPVAPAISDHEMDNTDHESTTYEANNVITDGSAGIELVTSAQGPLIKLNLAKMLAQNSGDINELLQQSEIHIPGATIFKKSSKKSSAKTSFAVLPLELSREIYRLLFVSKEPIAFTDRDGFARTAALLRTCRRVHDEGTEVLYGENAFHFHRARYSRGAYWEKTWPEIGYKDMRRFLNDIGPHNVAKLKYVSIEFDDASGGWSTSQSLESRRYVHDPVLIRVLEMLAANTVLEKFAVSFRGKHTTTARDHHFLKALCAIETRKFEIPGVFGVNHIDNDARRKVNAVMNAASEPSKMQIKKEKRIVPIMMHEMLTQCLNGTGDW